MPYQQRAPRDLRRHVITYDDVCRANDQVTRELKRLGFWNDALAGVQVYWVHASWNCYGWYEGDISIPAITGARLSELILGRHTRLTDVLRHEWAHGVADHWPSLINTPRFRRVFGGSYDQEAFAAAHDAWHHLTHYAASHPCEDFAEVFHFYLRHKGRLPKRHSHRPAIVRKWRFVARMASHISRHR